MLRRRSLLALAGTVTLLTGGAAAAQTLDPGPGCGSSGHYWVEEDGNGGRTTHYPDGSYVSTYTWTDQDGISHTVTTDQGWDRPGGESEVNC